MNAIIVDQGEYLLLVTKSVLAIRLVRLSAEKELTSWLSARAVPLLCSFHSLCSCPVLCLRKYVEFDCSVSDQSIFVYFIDLIETVISEGPKYSRSS